MKGKVIIITTASVLLFSCGESQKEADARKKRVVDSAQAVIDKTQHDIDSVERRYNRVIKLVNAGLDQKSAERMVDSMATTK